MALIKVTSRISPTTADGVLTESVHVKDESLGKLQSDINADLYRKINSVVGTSIGVYKGSVETYEDLPNDASSGDVYIVKTEFTKDDITYSEDSSWIFSESKKWEKYETPSSVYTDGKLTETKTEIKELLTWVDIN